MSFVIKISTEYRSDNTGLKLCLPALLTHCGILISALRFLSQFSKYSESWRERFIFSLKLLLKYIYANSSRYDNNVEMLRGFARAVEFGTIDPETLVDPSNLYWRPRSTKDARFILGLITKYCDWLVLGANQNVRMANPFRSATSVEVRLSWCAYYHRSSNVFLSHLDDTCDLKNKLSRTRVISVSAEPIAPSPPAKRFPDSKISDLMEVGWGKRGAAGGGVEIDYKGRCITILMNNGGLRISEVLQIYLSDIVFDKVKKEAVVRVFHPSLGASPLPRYRNRREFLSMRYQLVPRNEVPKTKRLHLGWKNPALTDSKNMCFTVVFYPPYKAKEFLVNYKLYLKCQRNSLIAEHPYAFVNCFGEPETVKNFSRLHNSAVERCGMISRKDLGTTVHAHRHAYAYRLKEAGAEKIDIQRSLHHKSLKSADVYTASTDDELAQKFSMMFSASRFEALATKGEC